MIPPYRCPPPYTEIHKKEELTGKVKSEIIGKGKHKVEELWVEVIVSGYRQYFYSRPGDSRKTEVFSTTIWRRSKDEEIDKLIIEDRFVAI